MKNDNKLIKQPIPMNIFDSQVKNAKSGWYVTVKSKNSKTIGKNN